MTLSGLTQAVSVHAEPPPFRGNRGDSFFRHPGAAHAIFDSLALRNKGRVVAYLDTAPPADSEGRIECQSGLHAGPRLVEPAQMDQGGGEIEMR
jgi:hypothetical protein